MRVQPKRVPSFSSRPGFPNGLRVLLIDTDTCGRQEVQDLLIQCNYKVTPCASASDAAQQLSRQHGAFDVILAEAKALGPRCKDSATIKQGAHSIPLILMGLNPSAEQVLLGIKLGAVDFLEKPLAPQKLRNIWQHTVRKMMADMDIKGDSACRRKPAGACSSSPTHSSSTGSNEEVPGGACGRMARQSSLQTNTSSRSAATALGQPSPSSHLPSAAALIQASNGLLERVQSHSNASQGSGSSGSSGNHCDSASTAQPKAHEPRSRKASAAVAPLAMNSKEAASSASALASPQGLVTPPGVPPPLVQPVLSPALPPIPPPPMAPLPPGMVWGMPMAPLVRAPGIVPPSLPAPANNAPWGSPAALAATAAAAASALLAPGAQALAAPAGTCTFAQPPQALQQQQQPLLPPQQQQQQAGEAAGPAPAAQHAPGSLAADMAATGCSSLPRISSCVSDLAAAVEEECALLFPELDSLLWEEPGAGAPATAGPAAGGGGDSLLGPKLVKSDSLMDLMGMALADGSLDALLAVESAA